MAPSPYHTEILEKIVAQAGLASCLIDQAVKRDRDGSCDPLLLASLAQVRTLGALADELLHLQGGLRARGGFQDWLLGWDADYFPAIEKPKSSHDGG